jgi:hypothetical protein
MDLFHALQVSRFHRKVKIIAGNGSRHYRRFWKMPSIIVKVLSDWVRLTALFTTEGRIGFNL